MLREHLVLAIALLSVSMGGQAQTCRDEIAATAPNSRFHANDDGTVADLATGLIWKQCAAGQSGGDCATGNARRFTWQQALQYAAQNPPWRLPNKKELASLVEVRCFAPAINIRFFPNTRSDVFWTSSPDASSPGNAWYVRFFYGGVYGGDKARPRYVRLVRGG